MFAVPGREARLGGWEKWERHMLRLNGRHVLGIKTGEFIVLTEEDVTTMSRERIGGLLAQALTEGPPRLSLRSRVKDWCVGTWRYYAKRRTA